MKYTIETVYKDRVTYAPTDKRRSRVSVPRFVSTVVIWGRANEQIDFADYDALDISVLTDKGCPFSQVTVGPLTNCNIFLQNMNARKYAGMIYA